jgi:hypothetical protein
MDYGEAVFENCSISSEDRLHSVTQGIQNVEALRFIMAVAERAPFEFALSRNSFREVEAKNDAGYLRWAYDVLDHWEACAEISGIPDPSSTRAASVTRSKFGYLSSKDALLIRDALALGCDSFLTMEQRLPRMQSDLEGKLGIRVLSPTAFWEVLKPWAGLFL